MTPTDIFPNPTPEHPEGEIRIGWASWDERAYQHRSIKWCYEDKSGKISRGSPEIPFDILLKMVAIAAQRGELNGMPELQEAYDEIAKRLP